jgi:LacI family transcriptional regulator
MNNNKRPTIPTVAAQAGLSVATVDRVLNARAPVNESTAQRVFEAAESVGYFAARLIGQRIRARRPSYRFGILLLATAQTFYGNFAAAIRQAAQAHAEANLSCQFEYIHDRHRRSAGTVGGAMRRRGGGEFRPPADQRQPPAVARGRRADRGAAVGYR